MFIWRITFDIVIILSFSIFPTPVYSKPSPQTQLFQVPDQQTQTALSKIATTNTQTQKSSNVTIQFEFLLKNMQTNLDNIRSGKGKLLWSKKGKYFDISSEKDNVFEAAFTFKEDKLRYDRTFHYNRISCKDANNRKVAYHFENPQKGIPYACINKVATINPGGEFFGEVIDIKRIMQFWQAPNETLLNGLKAGTIKETVRQEADKTFLVIIPIDTKTNEEFRILFDPQQGYNIIKEDYLQNGYLINRIQRTFKKQKNMWILDELKWYRYKPNSTDIEGIATVKIENMEINPEIPDDTFDIRGFELPANTFVVDQIDGKTYTFDSDKAINEENTKLLPVGSYAPNFEVNTLMGKKVRLSDFKGKYILLDFWATWCGPCVGEMSYLKKAYEMFGGDKSFVMIGLSLDNKIEDLQIFAKKQNLKWLQGFLGEWSKTDVPNLYGVYNIPAIILIGPDGKILERNLRGPGIEKVLKKNLIQPKN